MVELLPLCVAFVLGAVSPGPDFLVAVRTALLYNRKAGYLTALGFGCAVFTHVGYIAFGFGLLFQTISVLPLVIKYAGAMFLLYLGVSSLSNKAERFDTRKPIEEEQKTITTRKAFLSGYLTNLLNPYAALYLISLLGSSLATLGIYQKVMAATLFGSAYFLWFCLITRFLTHKGFQKVLNRLAPYIQRTSGVLLILIAIWIALKPI